MPTLMELQKRLRKPKGTQLRLGPEEVLIADVRAEMRPGDFVERKLRAALCGGSDSISVARRRPARVELKRD